MKTNIRRLDSVTHNDTAATKLINDNFEALQQGIEDAISRSGKTPNFMDAELDMNTRRIINCGDPVDDNDVVTVKWFKDTIVDIDALENKVDQEIVDRTNADIALSGAISDEENRAKGVEGDLSELTTTDKSDLVSAINEVDGDVASIEETIEDYGDIVTHDADEFATAAQGEKADTALQPEDVTEGFTNGTISVNGTDVLVHGLDSAAYTDATDYAANASLSINTSTYVVTLQLKDRNGNNLGSAQTIDLPLESIIVSGTYDSTTKSIILTLDNGNVITIPVGDLVSGLQTEITSSNKLDADLVDDSTSTNKFVTSGDKSTWSAKQDALVSGTSIKTINSESLLGSGNISVLVSSDIANMQTTTNLVTSVSGSSTDSQYPSAKLFYDTCGDIETLINAL